MLGRQVSWCYGRPYRIHQCSGGTVGMAATLDFPLEEYRERLTRLRQYMKESGLDGLLVTTEITHRYLSGHRSRRWINVNSPMASIYTSTGDALIVCDRF